MQRLFYLCNLHAGKGMLSTRLGAVVDYMTRVGYEVTIHPTQCQGQAVSIARDIANSCRFDVLYCSGGDGTLDEVVSGVMAAKHSIPIGYIPCGSTNDFARSIGIPKDLLAATQAVLGGDFHWFDVGRVGERSFVYVAAFGAFTDVTYATSQSAKNVFGSAAYMLSSLTRIATLREFPLRVTCDDRVFEDRFLYGMVTNSASVGGLVSMQDFYFDDGLFELTLLKTPVTALEFGGTISFLSDIHPSPEESYLQCIRGSRIHVELLEDIPMPWTLDGEFLQSKRNILIENHKRAVQLRVPKDYHGKCFV